MRDDRERYAGRDPLFERIYSNPKAKIVDCEDLIHKMDEESVDRSVILNANWRSLELCRETNDYIIDSVSRYPSRLVGFCSLPPKAGEAAITELERCIDGGIRGIGEMRPDIHGLISGDKPTLDPIFEIAIKQSLILNIHCSEPVGHEYPGKEHITPDVVYKLICRFPDLIVIGSHWGGGLPFYALMPEVAEALKNTYFDCSASPYLYKPEIFKHVAQLVGINKILFGSDYPLITPGRVIDQLRSIGMSDSEEGLILSGNAEALF